MTIRMNAALRRLLAGSALGGLIAFAAVPPAMAQWLPPWRAVAPSGAIAQQLEAQGYVLIAPLQRRPGVYLADVRAGPAGYQRLVIDDRNGEILERFSAPPRNFGPRFALRDGEFAGRPPPGFVQPPPGPGFPQAPDGGPAGKSAYGGPTNAGIPSAISPFDSPPAPDLTRPKPKSAATARKISPAKIAPAAPLTVSPPLPPPAPREAAKPDESAPPSPKPEPKIESSPGESENASVAPAAPEAKPAPAQTEPQAEAQSQPSGAAPDATAPAPSAGASDKSKVSVVPPALFE